MAQRWTEPITAEEIDDVLDRTIQALERINAEEAEAIAGALQEAVLKRPVAPVTADFIVRLQRKYLLLAKLISHTRLNAQLLHRVHIREAREIEYSSITWKRS